jgi:hypothetical protein
MLIDAIQNALANEPTINTLLGSSVSRKDSTNGIFPVQASDQPTMPYMVMEQVSGTPFSITYAGTGSLTGESWTISCYGSTYRNAKVLAKAVRLFLLNWLGVQTVGAVTVQGAYCTLESDESEPLARGTLFSTVLTFEFVYDDIAA